MKEKQQDELIFNQTLDKFPTITIPYPIFDKISEKLEIPSSKSIESLLVKLIIRSKVKYIEDVLKVAKTVGNSNSFLSKMLVIYVIGMFALPVFLLQRNHKHQHRQVNTRYALLLGSKSDTVKLSFKAYSFRIQSEQQVLSGLWSILTQEMVKQNILQNYSETQDTLQLRYDQQIYHKGVRLPQLLRITAAKMELVYYYPWDVFGIQLSQYINLMNFNSGSQGDDFQGFVDHLAIQIEKQIVANNSKDRYYLTLAMDDIFISQSEGIIFSINRQSFTSSYWKLIRPSIKFHYYHYRTGVIMETHNRYNHWSLAIILLETISMISDVGRFRKELKECNTAEEVRLCAEEFIKELERDNIFPNKQILGKIRDYLNAKMIKEHHLVELSQPKNKITKELSSQSHQDDQKPVMQIASFNNKEPFNSSNDH